MKLNIAKYQYIVADLVNHPRRSIKRVASDHGVSYSYAQRILTDLKAGGYDYKTELNGDVLPFTVTHEKSVYPSVQRQIDSRKPLGYPELNIGRFDNLIKEDELETEEAESETKKGTDWSLIIGFIIGSAVSTLTITYII